MRIIKKFKFKSEQSYNDWLSREDETDPDSGLRVYDGLFDPMKPFKVRMGKSFHRDDLLIGWDIVGDDDMSIAKCEWIAFTHEDFELIEEVKED